MAEIKHITAERYDESIALMQFAFQMNLSAERIEKDREYHKPEREYGLFDDNGRLLSRLTVLPLEAWIRGRKLAMGGVAGVASWPDARRQGGVSKLLQHAFARMKDQGQSLSMLAPFSFAFYRKFGYELTIERKKYTLETKHLPPRMKTPGTVRIVPKEQGTLEPVYAAFAAGFDGMLTRGAEVWERRLLSKPGIAAVYYDEADKPQGYMLYEVSEQTMKVNDWAVLTEDARTAMWSYAANHDSMIKQMTITVPTDDSLSFIVSDPRFKQEIEPYFMSRIVDAEKFVAQYPFSAAGRDSVMALAVEDAQAPWNDGEYRLSIAADGTARLERTGDGSGAAGLRCDIATLTAMLVGGRRPEWLHGIGRLQGADDLIAELERRVPMQRPYLADFF